METKKVVALFGDSLFIDTVELGLQRRGDVGVVRVLGEEHDALDSLSALSPDLIIVEMNDHSANMVIPLLQDHHDIPLLCLDVTCSKVVAVSCHHYQATSGDDLDRLIQQQTAHRRAC
ncbi:MAG TPA: hypothetical protein VLC95_07825 [Anaerolineae bacterium]|jgi:hypothetical protein|nr:hypothetical protein [Anaerolineae bacterium]